MTLSSVPGVVIQDKKEHVITVELIDLLREIPDGDSLFWDILTIETEGKIEDLRPYGFQQEDYQEEINESKEGFFISWERLNQVSTKFPQIENIVIIGSKDKRALRRYQYDEQMAAACDIVIIMFDFSYWKVFSKDQQLIEKLAKTFTETLLIDSANMGAFMNYARQYIHPCPHQHLWMKNPVDGTLKKGAAMPLADWDYSKQDE